jgi:hypothetical protein
VTVRRHAAVLAACLAVALVTPVGGRVVSRACAAGAVHVAIVVDTGSGSSVSALCVPAGSRDNGATLLATRASMLGTPQPRYAASGLLCAIDGFPATGCGERQNGHYAYWSYWHGGNGAWTYASVGPATTRVDPNVVEGWRWEPDGAASPVDPPPRVAPVAGAICKPAPPPPPPTTAAATTQTTARPSSPVAPATAPTTVGRSPGTSPGVERPRAGATTSSARARRGLPRRDASTGPLRPAQPRTTAAAKSPSTTVALAQGGIATATRGSGSSGAPVGLIVGGFLVAALFALGALAARRRRSTA